MILTLSFISEHNLTLLHFFHFFRFQKTFVASVKQLCVSFSALCNRTKTTNNHGKSLSTRWLLVWMTMCPSTSRTPTLWNSWSKWTIPDIFGIIITLIESVHPVNDTDKWLSHCRKAHLCRESYLIKQWLLLLQTHNTWRTVSVSSTTLRSSQLVSPSFS